MGNDKGHLVLPKLNRVKQLTDILNSFVNTYIRKNLII